MEPQVLIVEDDPTQGEYYRNWLYDIGKIAPQLRISAFNPDLVAEAADAIARLDSRKGRPYDLLLLDLRLEPGATDGFAVLKCARAKDAAREIIVVSGHLRQSANTPAETAIWNVLKAVRGGVADFVYKDELNEVEPLRDAVVRSLTRTVLNRSRDLFEARIKRLVPYAEDGLARHFAASFARCITEVGGAKESIQNELGERWGLDAEQDKTDRLVQSLARIDESLENGREQWRKLQASLGMCRPSSSEAVEIRETLMDLPANLEPCLIAKRAHIGIHKDFPQFMAQSFDGDVRAILIEMILGSLVALPDFGEKEIQLEFSGEIQDAYLHLALRDGLEPLSHEQAAKINQRVEIRPDMLFSRAWGLSVMQYAAVNGAGSLTVEHVAGLGNRVTYQIPPLPNV